MAKFFCICFQNAQNSFNKFLKLNSLIEQRLSLKEFSLNPSKVFGDQGFYTSIINPTSIQEVNGLSSCIGIMTEKQNDWHQPGGSIPDGNYALIRANETTIELVSDASSTRTIWYYKDEHVFIASSSQRAIILAIGSFEPNPETYPWFLSSGFHGPQMGWDKRITHVPSNNSTVTLNRKNWSLKEVQKAFNFSPLSLNRNQYPEYFKEGCSSIIGGLDLDYREWALPLSGGYDSRLLLLFLKRKKNLRTITWGIESSKNNPIGDAYIAKEVAKKLNVKNSFYPVSFKGLAIEEILKRFLISGEGRVDAIAGYVDGFETWNTFFQENIYGILRGDLAVSQMPKPQTIEDVWCHLGSSQFQKHFPKDLYKSWQLPKQTLFSSYQKNATESLTQYRDRLFNQFKIPSCHGGRNDLKLLFVETLAPIQTSKALKLFQNLPDDYRINKVLINKIAKESSPNVPFSTIDSVVDYKEFLRNKTLKSLLIESLNSSKNQGIFSNNFLEYIITELKKRVNKSSQIGKRQSKSVIIQRRIKKLIPQRILKLKQGGVQGPSIERLAFRVYIIIEMHKILQLDSKELNHQLDLTLTI